MRAARAFVLAAATMGVVVIAAFGYLNRPTSITVVNRSEATVSAVDLQVARGGEQRVHHGPRLEPRERHEFSLWCGECEIEVRAIKGDGTVLQYKNIYAQAGDAHTLEVREVDIGFAERSNYSLERSRDR